ncbi:ABC transporter ATP-binding protein [Actinomadura alba]|uniref:ABC transporter ATP-binding protein n=1 Tax=Actinomadura alba TaxID=406431 RepID=A0ABR7LTN7_9ACTN|nr:ABC transporter ATP-binding protein [Actinomadura alba]MBC6468217.1 ABC transporter ATP-binding protein [Actinomadura alba]
MAEVEISQLHKTYPGGGRPATRDVSLTVADGEFMVLLGPSGCGKTTLLRMIAGLELPDRGSVRIGGRDVTYRAPRERNLSMVFQSYAVFPHKKVADNIGFGLAMRKADRAVIQDKIAWAAGLLQLEDYLDRYPSQLSGGQRQRVAVARAIVMEPDVLLMDEPLSNLDALLRLQFRAELKKLLTDLGTTCVYVTHDQVEALSLGERVAVMKDGEIVQCGPPMEVYDSPASEFIGGFIGSPPMNFLDATLRRDGGEAVIEVAGQRSAAPGSWAAFAEGPVRIGVRAETITAHRAERSGALRAVTEVAEPLGSTTLVTAVLGEQRIKVQVPPDFPVGAGDDLWLDLRADRLSCYERDTGRVLVSDR